MLSQFSVKEQELIGATDRPNVLTVPRPIKCSNKAAMSFEDSLSLIVRTIVDVNHVVMRAYSQLIIFRIVLHALNPLFGIA